MNYKKFAIATVGGFIAIFIYEMLMHGFLMKGLYDATIEVWRPQDECNMALMFLSQVLFAGAMTYGYIVVESALKCKMLQFGIITGLILAMPQLATYCYLPIPLSISLLWMVAGFLKCVVCGLVIGFVYKKF